MKVNTEKKFVFIHVPKTGGSSMMAALVNLSGDSETLCHPTTKHETLQQFKIRHGKTDLNVSSYFKFGFVRNPWDKISSLYRYLTEQRPRPEINSINTFSEFLKQINERVNWVMSLHSLRTQVDYFTNEDGIIEADFIGRYESLTEDWNLIKEQLDLDIELPHANKSSHFGQDYRVDYSDQEAEIVGRHFKADLRHFGYSFDQVMH